MRQVGHFLFIVGVAVLFVCGGVLVVPYVIDAAFQVPAVYRLPSATLVGAALMLIGVAMGLCAKREGR